MNKLLLIDDEADIRRVLSMSLKSDGYEVLTAGSGEEGLEVFKDHKPPIVLTDIKMPGMDGLQVLKSIKEIETDTEVIIITGHGDIDSAIEALQHGASDFINKPVKDYALSIALERAKEKLAIRRQLREYTTDLETMVKIATEEFERKSNFQTKLIRSSNDGIIATDENWNIVIYNPGAQNMFGYTRTEVMRDTDARALYPQAVVEFFDREVDNQTPSQDVPWQEIDIVAKSGEEIPVRFSGAILSEKHQMMGSVAFFQDLREIRRLERELVHSERLAAIGQTVAGLAHCIKNILHGFKGGSYLVDIGIDKDNTDKLKSGWQMIQRNIQRTSDLVLDLLSYSKERETESEPCFPNTITADVCELMGELAGDYDVVIEQAFAADIGEVIMDPRSVHRVLLNLVSNAIDACIFDTAVKKQYVVKVTTAKEPDHVLRFEVADNGHGMSPEVKARLFASFFSTKGAKGTGLGLLVTRKLVEEHGGKIDVESEEHLGTTFIIRLPYKPIDTERSPNK